MAKARSQKLENELICWKEVLLNSCIYLPLFKTSYCFQWQTKSIHNYICLLSCIILLCLKVNKSSRNKRALLSSFSLISFSCPCVCLLLCGLLFRFILLFFFLPFLLYSKTFQQMFRFLRLFCILNIAKFKR